MQNQVFLTFAEYHKAEYNQPHSKKNIISTVLNKLSGHFFLTACRIFDHSYSNVSRKCIYFLPCETLTIFQKPPGVHPVCAGGQGGEGFGESDEHYVELIKRVEFNAQDHRTRYVTAALILACTYANKPLLADICVSCLSDIAKDMDKKGRPMFLLILLIQFLLDAFCKKNFPISNYNNLLFAQSSAPVVF